MKANLQLTTTVRGPYRAVMDQFDRDLFEALAPPYGRMEIREFTGSETGDRVHLRFLSPFRADWISEITEHGTNEQEAWFVDEGKVLPPGLVYWRHRHVVRKVDDQHSQIIDDITFSSWNWLFTCLAYPVLWMAFYPRKKIYRDYFGS